MNGGHECPTCRRPFPPRYRVSGPVRQRIVDIIANRPGGITRDEIADLVYGASPGGGPENLNVISTLIRHANKELAAQGVRITTRSGPGALYRLVPLRGRA